MYTSQQQKSNALCRAMGWRLVVFPHMGGTTGYTALHDGEETLWTKWFDSEEPPTFNLYDPIHVHLAWQILPWVYHHHSLGVGDELDRWWMHWQPIRYSSLHSVQEHWLDRCYNILLKRGIIKEE